MKHLYIIGNGFDIFTGLKSRYSDFQKWLEFHYAFIYEAMTTAYDIKGNWWCDFEIQLGNLNINKYVEKFRPPEMTWEEIQEKIKERKAFEEKYNVPPSLHIESKCAHRLEGLLDILQYCFEKWINYIQRVIVDPQYLPLEKNDSYFINFNYTDVIEGMYHISEERVLHIHGRASKKEHLVFGHNRMMLSRIVTGQDAEQVGEVLDRYHKNPYQYLFKYDDLPGKLKDIEYVHIYGLSFSPVDENYIDWIYGNTSKECKWEISWFSEEDKRRIDRFILNRWTLKERCKYVRLDDLKLNRES